MRHAGVGVGGLCGSQGRLGRRTADAAEGPRGVRAAPARRRRPVRSGKGSPLVTATRFADVRERRPRRFTPTSTPNSYRTSRYGEGLIRYFKPLHARRSSSCRPIWLRVCGTFILYNGKLVDVTYP